MKTHLKNRFTQIDFAALLVFVAVWVYYIVMVRYGVNMPDEAFYISIAERFIHGDRPLVDEWHISQLAHLFLCLPYKLFVSLTGSTDGIVLFMRYLFLAFNGLFYWCMYFCLHTFGWTSFIATLLFSTYVPAGLFTCNYYNVSIRLLMIVCLLLFSKREKPLLLLIAGLLFSCSVLMQPGFALLYFGYSILVLIWFIRNKKGKRFLKSYSFCIHPRIWLYFSISIAFCAVVFLTWLFMHSGLQNILSSLPALFLTDPEYDYSAQGSAWFIFFQKLSKPVHFYGFFCLSFSVLILFFSIAYSRKVIRSRRDSVRIFLFCLSCGVWVFSCIQSFRNSSDLSPVSFFFIFPLPMLWFGFVCFLLCEHKNTQFLFFWIVGLCSSLCVDFLSDVSLSIGGPIAYIADLVFFIELVRELCTKSPEKKVTSFAMLCDQNKKKRVELCIRWSYRLTGFCFAVWFAFNFGIGNTIFPEHHLVGTPLSSFSYRCEKGPCRSLHYPEAYFKIYNNKLADIDSIQKKHPKNLFVFGMAPELYLYAELPYATCSTWTWQQTPYLDRHIRYWQLHSERLPECIYFPLGNASNTIKDTKKIQDWICNSFDPLCKYTLEKGQCGYILYVSEWKPGITGSAS